MSTSFTSLGANHIGSNIKAFLDVFGMSNHVHVENACFVESLDDGNWGNADSADEQLSARVDDDGHELVEFSFSVVVAGTREGEPSQQWEVELMCSHRRETLGSALTWFF